MLLEFCRCGSNNSYTDCCECYISGKEVAPTAEALMRSRYTAYTLLNEDYLLATWHSSTRPLTMHLSGEAPTKWISLKVKRHEQQDEKHAIVEFAASYKVNGRAHQLHEVSRFVRERGLWFYVDGIVD